MQKKIGLITIWHVPNYGSVLQAFASQVLLEKLGFDCDLINYKYPNEWHYTQGLKRPSIKSRLLSYIRLKPVNRKQHKLYQFKKRFFKFSGLFNNLEELSKYDWSNYSAIIVGSDQVWNYKFNRADSAFLLSFVPQKVRRISLASSFAVKTIPIEIRQKYKRELVQFSAISVREQNGINIINQELSLNIDPKVILDPTLLIAKDEWLSMIPRSKFVKKENYILLYMLTYAFEPRPYIYEVLRFYQEKLGYAIYALEGYSSPSQSGGIRMVDKTDSSINEFIDLFNNADLVITSSFHGTAFAINFGRPLVSIIPEDKEDDRQLTLLKKVNLVKCCATSKTKLQDIDPYYDSVTNTNLNALRKESITWLMTALEN